jgi:hypothetical protein
VPVDRPAPDILFSTLRRSSQSLTAPLQPAVLLSTGNNRAATASNWYKNIHACPTSIPSAVHVASSKQSAAAHTSNERKTQDVCVGVESNDSESLFRAVSELYATFREIDFYRRLATVKLISAITSSASLSIF